MSWLLTDEEFAEALTALEAGDVTSMLYGFLTRLVRAVARAGLAPALSPTGKWDDDAIEEVLQAWLGESLLEGGLARSFEVCRSPKLLSRYLERALRNWLISKSRERGRPRLLARARAILEESPSYRKDRKANSPLDQWWGLAEWRDAAPYQGPEAELVKAAFSVSDLEPLRYSAGSSIADPVISNSDLERLMLGLFDSTRALLTLRHFDTALRGRFAYAFEEGTRPLELRDDSIQEPVPLETLEIDEVVGEILIELSGRQAAILRDRMEEELTLEQLAERYSVSRGTANNELKRAGAVIRRHLLDDSHAERVLERLLEVAFIG